MELTLIHVLDDRAHMCSLSFHEDAKVTHVRLVAGSSVWIDVSMHKTLRRGCLGTTPDGKSRDQATTCISALASTYRKLRSRLS